jgi:3-oxoadipate enol-lactonase
MKNATKAVMQTNMIITVPGNNSPRRTARQPGDNLCVTAGDLEVNYDDYGPVYAPPVVFIHGTPFCKGIWDLQAEALKSNYRVIAYDLRGHGGTRATTDRTLSIGLFTEDLIAFLDALGLEKVILCGISLGGYIALDAVDKYPDRFNALVLTGTQCAVDSPDVRVERDRMKAALETSGIEKYVDEATRQLFAATSFTTRKEEVRAVRKMMMETDARTILRSLDALNNRRESCGNLWSIRVPVLILSGKEDVVATPDASRFMRDNISGSVMHLIEYAGHLANLENTHEYNILLKRFIDGVCERKHLSRHGAGDGRSETKPAVK